MKKKGKIFPEPWRHDPSRVLTLNVALGCTIILIILVLFAFLYIETSSRIEYFLDNWPFFIILLIGVTLSVLILTNRSLGLIRDNKIVLEEWQVYSTKKRNKKYSIDNIKTISFPESKKGIIHIIYDENGEPKHYLLFRTYMWEDSYEKLKEKTKNKTVSEEYLTAKAEKLSLPKKQLGI